LKKTISFIINPISGGINKDTFPTLIHKHIDKNKFDIEIHFTKSAHHNQELAEAAVRNKKDIIVAVGGDGTINHVAKFVTGSSSIFGMIPMGSGNGLARHLNISLNHTLALKTINNLKTVKIDTGKANDLFFINVAGAGFDAHVSGMFATASTRGFMSYAKITLNEFAQYKPHEYTLVIDGKPINEKAFIVCVANGSQYGNNAFIAPNADLTDGIFEVSLIKPFRKRAMPFLGLDLFRKKFNDSKFVSTYRGKHIIIKRPKAEVVNIDGEPVMMDKDLTIEISPSSLNVIIP
jgi:YegS/Rv2252/BmrU family lipid kinase